MGQSNNTVGIIIEIDDVINYALVQNGVDILRSIRIKNYSNDVIEKLTIKIECYIELIEAKEIKIDRIEPLGEANLRNVDLKINSSYLAALTERIKCNITFSVYMSEEMLASDSKSIIALAYDQWPGFKYTPELLAAFSMPNHPYITQLVKDASAYLEKWTKDPSIAGYQYEDSNRVKQMAAAAYSAIVDKNIIYSNPPASFEEFGQRIRLVDEVIDNSIGTCMDLTLTYVACLEAMGLNPILILVKGHIFAGVWMVEDTFSDMIMDDPSHLEKRMASGINEIIAVECTAMCAGRNVKFDDAMLVAQNTIADYLNFEFVIDIVRARSMGIRPLPVRIYKKDNTIELASSDIKPIAAAPKEMSQTFNFDNLSEDTVMTKQLQWERKLLDMSMRNMLINFRFTKAVVPLLCANVARLEDELYEGEEFSVLPKPDNLIIRNDDMDIEMFSNMSNYNDYIELEYKHKKLHSVFSDKELGGCLTKLYRQAKTSLEENGASTLYIALGMLRWVDTKKTQTVRYAPIIMVPVDIVRKSAGKVYAIRMRDEDTQINVTLLEFLKQNYGIQINGLGTLPTDEHGLDIPQIFAIIRHGIMNMSMWDVLETAFIGCFSFSQFVMWNDMHNNQEMLEKNKIVRSLVKGAVDWDCTVPQNLDTDDTFLPISADDSQLKAINMAAGDVSFVLHGPPGTGKSQTITAMISNALVKGKRVLFVAEKMAALEVVQKRLDALGIGDFCMELHSNKATKKSVLDQLKKVLETEKITSDSDYEYKLSKIHELKEEIDVYVRELHKKRNCGKSVREIIDDYEALPECDVNMEFDSAYVEKLTIELLDNNERLVEQLVATGKAIGHPHNHPLAAIRQTEYSQTLKLTLEEMLNSYIASIRNMKISMDGLARLMEARMPATFENFENFVESAKYILVTESIPEMFINDNAGKGLDNLFEAALAYVSDYEEFLSKEGELLQEYNELFLQENMSLYREKYDKANEKLLLKGHALKGLASEIKAFAKREINVEEIPLIIARITKYQQQKQEMSRRRDELPYEWKQIIDKYPTKEKLLQYKGETGSYISVITPYIKKLTELKNQGKLSDCIEGAQKFLKDVEAFRENENVVAQKLGVDFDENNDANWLFTRESICRSIINNAAQLKEWIVFRQFEENCNKAGINVVCKAYEEGVSHELLRVAYQRSIYKAIVMNTIENNQYLNTFTGNGFNELIIQFKKLDAEIMELTKEEMVCRLSNNLPDANEGVEISRELNILRRAISSNGRGVSIRALFDQIPNILSRMCPCMLMSPISVASYLSLDNPPFDIVVFDEASQLPTCKAVGVLARGNNAVIVGDPNQMPPTSFFAGNAVDEDNLELEDLDSILDDCLALGMPSAHLKWHYRSRHESLIAFSNNEFYENSMLTFPSVNDRERQVKFVKVEGNFSRKRGRVNENEAKAIVAEIKNRFADEEKRHQSIGVVTFNISQQALIEDMLSEEFSKNSELEEWANNSEEPVFVKNLENVQGDERDVILFSVAFGPDEDGKVSMNFGPLNKAGGYKRLNVAVTRAKNEMMVFSTLTAEMIDLRRTKAKGVEALKNFLDFAANGKIHMNYRENSVMKNKGIIDTICAELTRRGFKYQTMVGHSRFKVDIAIVDPKNEERYVLGVLLDGESYKQTQNTKDREVAQQKVLSGLGWNLYRMWSMDWWDNKEKELENLIEVLEKNMSAV